MKTKRIEIRATREERSKWRIAAALKDVSLGEWMREQCNQAAAMSELTMAAMRAHVEGKRWP